MDNATVGAAKLAVKHALQGWLGRKRQQLLLPHTPAKGWKNCHIALLWVLLPYLRWPPSP